ncbi:hypothetical protein L7F22_068824 [Adiantum nelumboides]|nr:hypothetical protein [Adiantum nelumboides]
MNVRKVLEILRQHQFYAKESKCTFCSPQVSYLGFIISADGISVDPKKIKDIVEWPQPSSVSEVRGFLGITGWYRIFVKDYALITAPLTGLLKKGMRIDWKAEHEASFSQLKGYLVSSPILKLPDSSKEFEVVTDASGLALGGVLTQEGRPSPKAPINLVNVLISNVLQQIAKFPNMGLYKAGYVWHYLYYATTSETQKPQVSLALAATSDLARTTDTGKRLLEGPVSEQGPKSLKLTIKLLEPLKDIVPVSKKPQSITIQNSPHLQIHQLHIMIG